ncbi:MAG: tRNA lysidine(34) synthetase TilS [Burkholderiales bacterium]|nr:tRNA lysidine(34) synthetase TilS [Burkholderiales bacterium]
MEHPADRLRAAAAAALAAVPTQATIAVALSGGRDSVALLDILDKLGVPLRAIHVHHGLSPHADAWAAFCEALCATRGVPCTVCRVAVPAQASVENQARRERYAALAAAAGDLGVRYVALGHHRDDQAETLVLQLLRGAGPPGLAAMPALRDDPRGVAWWRPLLAVTRADIDAYVRAAGLRYVDDESNAHTHLARNAVRHVVMPVLAQVAGNAPETLARAAANQAEAAQLLDELACLDGRDGYDGTSLARRALAELPPHRARNLLRWFLRRRGLAAPASARLAAMLDQLANARPDARVRIAHAGAEVGIYRDRVIVHPPPPPAYALAWSGEAELRLPHGRLAFGRADGDGIAADRIAGRRVHVRPRAGGERLQLAANRPRRALKSILQDAGVPPWERQRLPLVYCDDALAAVPGIGVDAAFATAPDAPGITLTWLPDTIGN